MEYIKETLPGLWGGVSQQTPAVRLKTQCSAQKNMINDPVNGVSRRPPFKDTGMSAVSNCKLHSISKDNERYLMIFEDRSIKVLDTKTLTYKPVQFEGNAASYFKGFKDIQKELKCITIHDTTFVLNTTRQPRIIPGSKTAPVDKTEAFITVDNWYEKTLDITVGNKTVTKKPEDGHHATIDDVAKLIETTLKSTDWDISDFSKYVGVYELKLVSTSYYSHVNNATIQIWPDGRITGVPSPNQILIYSGEVDVNGNINIKGIGGLVAERLTGHIDNNFKVTGTFTYSALLYTSSGTFTGKRTQSTTEKLGFNVERKGAVIRATYHGGANVSLHDGFIKISGRAIKVRAGSVPTFQDLWPPEYWANVKLRIQQSNHNQVEGYYVYSDGISWEEAPGYNITTTLDSGSMPHKIVRQSDGSFKVSRCEWEDRQVGDDDSAPLPSFLNKPLNNLFFHQNRLSFITEDSIIMSRTGDYFNFFPKTALEVLDDDPVDITVGSAKTSKLLEALPFNKQIILRGSESQHLLSYSGTYLSPTNTAIDITTLLETYPYSQSGVAGSNLYFLSPEKGFTQVQEYFLQPDTYLEDTATITAQIPRYITGDINKSSKILSCPEKDMLFVFTDLGSTNKFYVYNYLWQGEDKPVSSWNTWTLPRGYTLADAAIIGTTLYCVLQGEASSYSLAGLPATLSFRLQNDSLVPCLASIDISSKPENYLDLDTIDTEAFIQLSPWYLRDDNNNPIMNSLQLRKLHLTLEPTTYRVDKQIKTRNENTDEGEVIDTFYTLYTDAHNANIKISSIGGNPMTLKTATLEGFTSERPRFLR